MFSEGQGHLIKKAIYLSIYTYLLGCLPDRLIILAEKRCGAIRQLRYHGHLVYNVIYQNLSTSGTRVTEHNSICCTDGHDYRTDEPKDSSCPNFLKAGAQKLSFVKAQINVIKSC